MICGAPCEAACQRGLVPRVEDHGHAVCCPCELKGIGERPEARPRFWELWDRLPPHAFPDAPGDVTDTLTAAPDTPSGHLTRALLDSLANTKPQPGSDLPDDVWKRLALRLTGDGQSFELARVVRASRLAWLYGSNPAWVEEHSLPYFEW